MTHEEAKQQLLFDVLDDDGVYVQLRLGNDPGVGRVHRLRLALRVLWRYWKSHSALPYDIVYAATCIIHFQSEALQNLQCDGHVVRQDLVHDEIPDLEQGAFDLLAGKEADQWTVHRKDLDG